MNKLESMSELEDEGINVLPIKCDVTSTEDINNAALAVDNIDIASPKKIPLWAFGFLY